ncbi:MAG: putative ABC transport system permease protein [Rhodothermales bacterium]|jgi:putative ABC transport system permease protein
MFSCFSKAALRGMRRHGSYSLINVLGLSIGFLAAFLILLWVRDEAAFDAHYDDVDQVYRVMRISSYGEGQVFTWPAITAKLDHVLDEDFAAIEHAALVSWNQNLAFRTGEVIFQEDGRHAGKDLLSILKHDFLAGDPATALDSPESIVLSETMARKYFHDAFEGASAQEASRAVIGGTLNLENTL